MMEPKIVYYKHKCFVPGCTSMLYADRQRPSKNFFQLPQTKRKRRQWVNSINRTFIERKVDPSTTTTHFICESHFAQHCFKGSNRTELKSLAVPSIFNFPYVPNEMGGPSNARDDSPDSGSDLLVSDSDVDFDDVPGDPDHKIRVIFDIDRIQQKRISKYKAKFVKTRSASKILRFLASKHIVNDLVFEIYSKRTTRIKPQFISTTQATTSWSMDAKTFALGLYRKKGPIGYNKLRKLIKLPDVPTLKGYLDSIPFNPGTNPRYFDKLKSEASEMSKLDKVCSLMFAEFPLTEQFNYSFADDNVVGFEDFGSRLGRTHKPANKALVFMLQGLHAPWKQPVVYYLSRGSVKSRDLAYFITEVIAYVQSAGLNIVSTVCTHSPTNRGALQLVQQQWRVSTDRPYLNVNNQKSFIFYDTPQLLKSTRNSFLKYTINYDNNKQAKFEHLAAVFDFDKMNHFPILGKIKGCHLDPRHLLKKRHLRNNVDIAAKTLSNTMAAAINTFVIIHPNNARNSEAMTTAELVYKINRLFDSLNCGDSANSGDPSLKSRLDSRSGHVEFWDNIEGSIRSWKFLDEAAGVTIASLPFKEAWINNITSSKLLWSKLKGMGFDHLSTRRLNMDPLRNLFFTIGQYKFFKRDPTCMQFTAALKACLLNDLATAKSYNKKYEDDDGYILNNLQDFLKDE